MKTKIQNALDFEFHIYSWSLTGIKPDTYSTTSLDVTNTAAQIELKKKTNLAFLSNLNPFLFRNMI